MRGQDASFLERYGPWALVLGASNGVGAAYAAEVARRGVNVVLVSRRQAVLDEIARSISEETGVESRSVAIDLAGTDAFDNVVRATKGLEIGTLMYCAGADPNFRHFLDSSIEFSLGLIHRNCVVPTQLCHNFAPAMVERGRGAIVLVGSAAGLHGGPNMTAYGGTKAFDIVFGEALWSEVHDKGVDVLNLVIGATDTPAFRQLLFDQGITSDPSQPAPVAGVTSPEETAAEAIANLANGPTWVVGERVRERLTAFQQMSRNDVVRLLIDNVGGTMQRARSGESS